MEMDTMELPIASFVLCQCHSVSGAIPSSFTIVSLVFVSDECEEHNSASSNDLLPELACISCAPCYDFTISHRVREMQNKNSSDYRNSIN